MGELKIKLPDEVERLFRRIAMKRFGYQKGAMSHAASEAINEWVSDGEDTEEYEDPIKAISGLMKHVKKSSVQLQHEAFDELGRKHANRR